MIGFGMDHGWGWVSEFSNYKSAKAFLEKGRDKTSRPVAWKTRLNLHDNGDITLRYHKTDVVTYHPDGSISLDSGGWKTQTTKRRINDYTDMRIFPDKGVWYVCKDATNWHWKAGEGDLVFQDEMRVFQDWKVQYLYKPPDAKEIVKLRKSISKYARNFAENLPGLGLPDSGDCWFCYMQFDGEETTNTSHLLSHIEDGYFVPSLAFRAMKEAGVSDYLGYSIQELMRDGESWDGRNMYIKTWATRFIRKYIQKRLGLSVG